MATKTKKSNKPLYLLAAFLLLGVIGLALAGAWSDRFASVIFDSYYLRIVYGVLSLAVAVVTFGLIGDSEALVKSDNPKGLVFKLQELRLARTFVLFSRSFLFSVLAPGGSSKESGTKAKWSARAVPALLLNLLFLAACADGMLLPSQASGVSALFTQADAQPKQPEQPKEKKDTKQPGQLIDMNVRLPPSP